ncbi:radical SAM protein [Halorubrum vacuolatum]|uniref:Radical SAM additional 4Fe4S-binding SPASM domain-containing protein n=1 Tax=Halorubrum vacuolatum TaxID=63740 RepID=A0A238V6L8_HALVU|nr:radical SAM protein [Halorubrum vacuolatum]SNR30075.1 radical SAM additional 4Fe4S-binding SPASM domain-containing protein [Halorubrum vacuolatum]
MFGVIDVDQSPLVLIWEVTQACGLACRHCRAAAVPRRHPEELDTEEAKALLDDAAEFGDGQLVVLSGGDPLMREDLPELVRYGTDRGLRMAVTPSGTRSLTRERIAELADAGMARMAVSLDGATRESHDAFRGEESYADTIAAAEAAREHGIPVQVNTTVCADTVEELPAIRELVGEVGVVLWSVFFLVRVGRGGVLTPISPVRAEGIMEWLHDVDAEEPFGVKTTEAPFYRRVGLQREDGGREGSRRRAGVRAGCGFAFVSHTGEVYPSGFLPLSAGNVRESSIVDVYRESALFRSLRNPDGFTGKCGACEFRHVCGGSRSRAYAETGDPAGSDPLCPYVPEGYDGPLPARIAD